MIVWPLVLLLVFLPTAGSSQGLPEANLVVSAAAAPGGTGTHDAPFARIADALEAGRDLAATHEVTISVGPGNYTAEPRPLVFDFPVTLEGSTELARDASGLATGQVANAATLRGVAANQTMIHVSGHGVTIRGLKVEGGGAAPTGVAVAVDKSPDFAIAHVHVSGVMQGIVASASTGHIRGSYLGPPLTSGIVVGGGNLEHPADVRISRNRLIDYSSGGIALIAAADPLGTIEPFHTLSAKVDGNVASTNQPISGPSNPYGLRINLVYTALSDEDRGVMTANVAGNVFSGNHRYPLIVNAGQIERVAFDYTADLDVHFKANQWLAGPGTVSRIILTFTNSRMGLAPFWNELATRWEYLEASTYLLRHDGELDSCFAAAPTSPDCRVDHPEIEPCDDRVLGNVLTIRNRRDNEVLPYGTFVPDVCP